MLIDITTVRNTHITDEAAAKSWQIDPGMDSQGLSRSRIYLADANGHPEKMATLKQGWDSAETLTPANVDPLSIGALPILALRDYPGGELVTGKAFAMAIEYIKATKSYHSIDANMLNKGLQMVIVAKVDDLSNLLSRLVIVPTPNLLSVEEVSAIAEFVDF